jgi:hypothetical protein
VEQFIQMAGQLGMLNKLLVLMTILLANPASAYFNEFQTPAHSYYGNNTGSTATVAPISSTQVTADLNLFTTLLQGLTPASGGGSTNFLRADGTWAAPAGSGSVTSVSVVSANGLAGTVATATTTPAITLSTTITGVLKGNGTAISAATSGTDYSAGTSGNATGIVKSTTGTGALTTAIAADFPTLNQNTTGTAANLSGTPALPNGTTATTQAALDNSTKLATTAYADAAVSKGSSLIEVFTGHIIAPGNYTFVLDQSAAYAYTINSIIVQTSAGTDTLALKIGGTSVTGCSAVSVSSTPATGTCTAANSVSTGNRITLVTSADASAADLTFTVKVTRQ